jgi:hypothetical protein
MPGDERKLLTRIEMDLYLAAKLERDGRGQEARWPVWLIPNGPDRQLALDAFQQIVDSLRRRGVDVVVTHTPAPGGEAFMLTLPEPPTSAR